MSLDCVPGEDEASNVPTAAQVSRSSLKCLKNRRFSCLEGLLVLCSLRRLNVFAGGSNPTDRKHCSANPNVYAVEASKVCASYRCAVRLLSSTGIHGRSRPVQIHDNAWQRMVRQSNPADANQHRKSTALEQKAVLS